MRSILIDFLMDISSEFMLKRETFYISINMFDRFLTKCHNIKKH